MGKSTFLGVFCFLKEVFIWARRWKWSVYCVCQMTNCPQRRFESFVRWQIARRDVLSHLSGDKSSPETFWDERSLHFKKNNDLRVSPFWSFAWKGIFMDCHADARNDGWKSPLASPCPLLEFYKFPQSSGQPPIRGAKSARILFGRLAGGKIMDCHADARNDGWKSPLASPCPLPEFHKLPQSFGQLPIRVEERNRRGFSSVA